jgi:alpha-beta hydrolase superfamily lysophospholipase
VLALLRQFEHNQVYHPSREWDSTGAELGRAFENVVFKSADGVELSGWFFPANANSSRAQMVILFCHGNAGNIGSRLDFYEAMLETGAAVFSFDYRGYGRSGGRPSEEGTYLDAQAAHQWLRQKGFAGKNIIVYGESLGGGIASETVLREESGGLVLQGTFTCIADLGGELFPWLPVRWISRIRYDTCGKLPRIKVPVLVMHSRGDALIRFRHSERNFAAANAPKLFCELRGDHNDPLGDRSGFIRGLDSILKIIEQTPSSVLTTRPV